MAAATQLGTACKIAFGSFAYTGYVPEDGLTWKKPMGNIGVVTDEDGATMTKILMDARDEFSMSLIILDSGGSITPPQQGVAVSITDPANATVVAMVQDATVTFSRGESKLSMDLIKEASMTYS